MKNLNGKNYFGTLNELVNLNKNVLVFTNLFNKNSK
jgi:hypothetical protein